MKKFCLLLLPMMLICFASVAEDLAIEPEDLIIEQSLEGGYNLWVREKPGIKSILLTESTADPAQKAAVYSLRAVEWNKYNGDEKRMLNGEFISPEKKLYSLIDSTPEAHDELGSAFRVFIPYIVKYGYNWTRNGEILVVDGTFLSVRAFGAKFADYRGGFRDNPFTISVTQKPMEGTPEGNYMDDTVTAYTEIAEEGGGMLIYCTGEEDLLNALSDVLDEVDSGSLDLVLALDTTASMKNDIPWLKRELVPLLRERTDGYRHFRFGMVLYRDYHEEYLTRVRPFKNDLKGVQGAINRTTVFGGRDIPEAVYEALYEGIHAFPWLAEDRKLILIGDAPPHERPRGKITKEMVYEDAGSIGVEITAIILPQ